MDLIDLEQHSVKIRTHVTEGAEHIERQRQIIADLERDGHDATTARDLLRTFEEMQQTHVAELDRVTRKLAELASKPA